MRVRACVRAGARLPAACVRECLLTFTVQTSLLVLFFAYVDMLSRAACVNVHQRVSTVLHVTCTGLVRAPVVAHSRTRKRARVCTRTRTRTRCRIRTRTRTCIRIHTHLSMLTRICKLACACVYVQMCASMFAWVR